MACLCPDELDDIYAKLETAEELIDYIIALLTPAEVEVYPAQGGGGIGGYWPRDLRGVDEALMEILQIIISTGLLD